MKLALVMMIHIGDAPWLKLHLPSIADCFDGAVIVADPREALHDEMEALDVFDHPDLYASRSALVTREFDNNWSAQFNAGIEEAERRGYDALIRLDPDEAVFPSFVDGVRSLLETYSVLCFSRINYWKSRLRYTPGLFPDWQCRAWQLGKGIRLGGQHHEGVNWLQYGLAEGDPVADTPRQVLRVPHLPIYHYGNVGRERILERDLHYLNVARETEGHPPLTERPVDRAFPTRHSVPFRADQPLDPNIVGVYAPFKE